MSTCIRWLLILVVVLTGRTAHAVADGPDHWTSGTLFPSRGVSLRFGW